MSIKLPSIFSLEPEEAEPASQTTTSTTKQHLEQFLNHLPNCVNRELIDNAAAEFLLSLNAKNNKRKLVRYVVKRLLDFKSISTVLYCIYLPCFKA